MDQATAEVESAKEQDETSAEAATEDRPAAELQPEATEEAEGDGGGDSDDEGPSPRMMSQIREMLLERGFRPKLDPNGEPRPPVLSSFDADGIVEYLRSNSCQNVVVMAGATQELFEHSLPLDAGAAPGPFRAGCSTWPGVPPAAASARRPARPS